MCNCKTEIELQLVERFEAKHPEATGHSATLEGRIYGVHLHDEPPDDEPMGSRILISVGLVAFVLMVVFAGPITRWIMEIVL